MLIDLNQRRANLQGYVDLVESKAHNSKVHDDLVESKVIQSEIDTDFMECGERRSNFLSRDRWDPAGRTPRRHARARLRERRDSEGPAGCSLDGIGAVVDLRRWKKCAETALLAARSRSSRSSWRFRSLFNLLLFLVVCVSFVEPTIQDGVRYFF
jgi:hypothetical protein